MIEQITYIANDGTSFISKEECIAHDKKIENRNAAKKEKIELLNSIRDKYDSLIEDIENFERKYDEPVTLTGNKAKYITIPEILREVFNMV